MKKVFTLVFTLYFFCAHAQTCTTTGFETCDSGATIKSDFRNAVQIEGTGNPLSIGAKYKFSNAVPDLHLDAVVTINAIVNATMKDAGNPGIDDDAATNETGAAASQVALFAPHIAPDQILSCTNRSGYVEFTIRFYTHYNGNIAPADGTEIAISNLNFLNYDMDGSIVGTNGWFKETGAVKTVGPDPANYNFLSTELTNDANNAGWLYTYGSTTNRTGLARCAEVTEKSVYINPISTISFRLGYDYKAPANCNGISMQPTADYGIKLSCFYLPAAGPLPVSLVNLGATYQSEKANITWKSLQENNLDSYEIQRSFDGVNFEVAGNVKANNLTTVQLYKFTDNIANYNCKYIYYRIRVVDFDHSMKLTNTVILKVDEPKANEMIISPNPSSSNALVKVKVIKACTGTIAIYDAAGKVVLTQQASLLMGNNSIIINNITSLSDGCYTIRLMANNETFTSKLLVWK
jgi:hypothetical protein